MQAPFALTRPGGLGEPCKPEYPTGLFGQFGITAATLGATLRHLPHGFHARGYSTDRVVKVNAWHEPGLVQLVYPRAHFGDEDAEVVDHATAAAHLRAYLHGLEVVEGVTHFTEWINQGERPCSVERVGRTRFRIAFDMPNCEQGGWRHGTVIKGRMFYVPRYADGW